MKKLEIDAIPLESGCNYPPPFDAPCLGSSWRRLARARRGSRRSGSISRGCSLVSQRHWHSHEDEFVMK